MDPDRRASPRDNLSLPIELAGGGVAMTRNVSAGGLFFTVPAGTPVEPWLQIEFEVPSAGLKFSAAGEVVRIQRGQDEDGVALRLHMTRLTPLA